jgi:hypothetical protein
LPNDSMPSIILGLFAVVGAIIFLIIYILFMMLIFKVYSVVIFDF